MRHYTILIIDDSPSDRYVLEQSLLAEKEISYAIIHSSSAAAGLALCSPQLPDGILLEIKLPDGDGFEFLTQLKELTRGNCPPVIVVSCQNDAVTAAKAFKNGVEDYLVKGHTADDVRLAMRSAIKNAMRLQLQGEDLFRTSIENLLDCFGIYTAIRDNTGEIIDFRIDYLNRVALESGHLTVDAIGKTLSETFPGYHESKIFAENCHMVETGESRSKESFAYSELFPDEYLNRIYDVRSSKLGDGFVSTWRDVTANREAKQTLQEANQRITTIWESMTDAYITLDREWRVIYANQAAAQVIFQLANLEPEAFIGKSHWEIFPTLVGSVLEQEYQRAMTEQVAVHLDILYEPTGNWIEIHAYPSVEGLGVYFRNISDRKQAELALQEQTKLSQVIVNSIGDGLILANSQGEFVIFNRAAQEIFGPLTNARSPADWSTTFGVYLPDQQTLFPAEELPLARAIRGEHVTDVEIFVRLEQATAGRWISVSGFPVVDISSEITGGVVVCRDITERKIAEVALSQSQERYRLLAESIPQFVFITSADGKNEFVNQQFCNYTGLSVEQLLHLDWLTIIHPDDVERTQERWMKSVHTGCLYEIEYRFRHANGTYRWFLGQGVPMTDEHGLILKWIGTCTDIDQQKQLEAERIRLLEKEQTAREAAEKANRIKDEFLAVLSHELRSPLNPILGWSKLLQTGNLNAIQTANALATIERNAKLQSQLIEDLLDVSRILQGKLSLNVTSIDLASTIASAIETVRLAAEAKNIQIQVLLAPDVKQISGDAGRLQQIVWNLLSNAVKFTPKGGLVEVRLTQVEDHAQIQVIDTGKGILPDFLPDVFEHFRQEDGATTRKFGGLGLGLAIVRQLVELHGGTVEAESLGVGQGATFTVRIPITSTSLEMISNGTPTQSLDLSGLQILVVDDDPDSREFVAFVLKEAGASVLSLSSGIEALKVLSQVKQDILVSDIGMPEMDGYMLIREIRARVEWKEIPAIALTAYAGEIDQKQALAAGFQRHLSKPVDPDTLVEMVAQLARRVR